MRSAKIEGFENYTIYENGDVWSNKGQGCKLKPFLNGYYRVLLYNDGKSYGKLVHRLLGLAFIPNPENKPCIDHIDRDKTNNNLFNLRWVTIKENNNNRDISKGWISIIKAKNKKGDKVYERVQFHRWKNGKEKRKNFNTMEEAKKFQLLSFCFHIWCFQ